MIPEAIQKILSSIATAPDDSSFYPFVFSAIAQAGHSVQAKEGDNLKRVSTEEYDSISKQLDVTNLQESCAVRNILRTRRLANLLINDHGELVSASLPALIHYLQANLYSFGPNRQYDSLRQEQILKALISLKNNKEMPKLLKRIGKPHNNQVADQIIRETLQIPSSVAVTDAHARRAALAAWMCTLRQHIGSCFATAPAILIHDEQPESFFNDLIQLLGTGRLKRTYGGVEYSVPLSVSWGIGNLRKPILMAKDKEENSYSFPWYAPGILLSLEEVGLLDKEMSIKEKINKGRELILKAYPEWTPNNPYCLTNAEDIFSRVLLNHLDLTENDLIEFDKRPIGMIHSSLLMQTTPTGMGGKGEACTTFYRQFEQSKNVFKALTENALLKAWEFTLASFSEIKAQFTRWNLYSSLGLQPDQPGGIGQCIYNIIKDKLDRANQRVAELQIEYEQVYGQLKFLESRSRNVSSEKEAQWTRAEYQSRLNEFYTFEEIRNKAHAKAEIFADLFNVIMEAYDALFPTYFQEVYDADLHEVKSGPFDDSPAGFRLLYKYGIGHTTQWTKIRSPQEFVDALSKFFVATEKEIMSMPGLESVENDISEIVTAIVSHVRTQEFLESAFYRMAQAHNVPAIADPLEHLDRIVAKPWAYVSGGTMDTLLNCYYLRDQKMTEKARWVENPMELLVFFIETLALSPPNILEGFIKDQNKSMLAHSPTHAFLVKPGLSSFKQAWQSTAFTYTWVRDTLIQPMNQFVDNLILDDEMMSFFVEKLTPLVPGNFQYHFKKVFGQIRGSMSSCEFRDHLIDTMEKQRGLKYNNQIVLSQDDIDSMLYDSLPLFPSYQLTERLQAIWQRLSIPIKMQNDMLAAVDFMPSCYSRILSAQNLQEICMALLCLSYGTTSSSVDMHRQVTEACQSLGYSMPAPIIIADTNWELDYFSLLVSPGSGVLEFWRTDHLGRIGAPMSSWKEWLNGSRKDRTWGLYTNPFEYTPGIAISIPQFRAPIRFM